MIYMVLQEYYTYASVRDGGQSGITYEVPTALTGCIAGTRIREAVAVAHQQAARWRPQRATLTEFLDRAVLIDSQTGEPYGDD